MVKGRITKTRKVREPVPARKLLAITLHWLATSPSFHDLAEKWGAGKSTVSVSVHQVVTALEQF